MSLASLALFNQISISAPQLLWWWREFRYTHWMGDSIPLNELRHMRFTFQDFLPGLWLLLCLRPLEQLESSSECFHTELILSSLTSCCITEMALC